jgi:hypothetical protein
MAEALFGALQTRLLFLLKDPELPILFSWVNAFVQYLIMPSASLWTNVGLFRPSLGHIWAYWSHENKTDDPI